MLVLHPLSRKTLSNPLRNCRISQTLSLLHSLLVPASDVDPIRISRKSFLNFLTDSGRCKGERFFVDPLIRYAHIPSSCLNLMKERLKKDICDLDDYAILGEVKDLPARRKACIGEVLKYACRFWKKYFAGIPGNCRRTKRVQEAIDEFFAMRSGSRSSASRDALE